jgi:hypothetical protein
MDLKQAYAGLKEDEKLVKSYLLENSVAENEVVFGSVDIHKNTEEKIVDGNRLNVFGG